MKHCKRKLRNHFIPHQENDYRPHLLRKKSLAMLGALVIVVKVGLTILLVAAPGLGYPSDITTQNVVNLTNQARKDAGLPELKLNNLLNQAAVGKANDMLSKEYFAHESPTNVTPWYWFKQAGYNYAYAGENLAMDFFTSEDTMKAWLASPSHKKNILNSNYKEIGIGIAKGNFKGASTIIVVQHFAAPKPAVTVAKAETTASAPKPAPQPTPQPTPQPVPAPKPAPKVVSESDVKKENIPQPEPEKTTVIPSAVTPDTYDIKTQVTPEPAKVEVQLGNNQAELTKTEDVYVGSIKEEDKGLPSDNIQLALSDKTGQIVTAPIMSLEYFKTNILKPDRILNSEFLIKMIFYSRNFFLALMIFLTIILILNVLIKIQVQHRPTIVYTLLLLYTIGIMLII
jgi:hypothetical protein